MALLKSGTFVLWALYIEKFDFEVVANTKFWQSLHKYLGLSFVTHFYCGRDKIPKYWYTMLWKVLKTNRDKHNFHTKCDGWQEVVRRDMW
jgi:hypothetical protein